MRRALVAFGLAYVALVVAGCWYGHLLHAPAERNQEDEERRLTMAGIDTAIVYLRQIQAGLRQTEYPLARVAAGMQ